MAKLNNSISGFLTVVAFLVLTALAASWQGGGQAQSSNSHQSAIYQKARSFAQTILFAPENVTTVNLKKKVSWSEKIKKEAGKIDSNKIMNIKSKLGFSSWSGFVDKITAEKPNQMTENVSERAKTNFITGHRSEDGNFFVIEIEDAGTYRLPLPSEWFSGGNKKVK